MQRFRRALVLALLLTGTFIPGHAQVADSSARVEGRQLSVDVLSDHQKVADMSPYMRDLISNLRSKWLLELQTEHLQPKPQETLITVTLAADGKVLAMHLDSSTEDESAGEAAWDAVKNASYAPLPADLKAPDLKLRLHFTIK